MKKVISLVCLIFFLFYFLHFITFAETNKKLALSENIFQVKTKVVYSASLGKVNYRAVVMSEGSEGGFKLHLEKFVLGEEGVETNVLINYKIYVNNIFGFQTFYNQMAKKSFEQLYGCCEPFNLNWDKNNELHFELLFKERLIKGNRIEVKSKTTGIVNKSVPEKLHFFRCESSSLDQYKISLKCNEKPRN